jgi:hypothetical protein
MCRKDTDLEVLGSVWGGCVGTDGVGGHTSLRLRVNEGHPYIGLG